MEIFYKYVFVYYCIYTQDNFWKYLRNFRKRKLDDFLLYFILYLHLV